MANCRQGSGMPVRMINHMWMMAVKVECDNRSLGEALPKGQTFPPNTSDCRISVEGSWITANRANRTICFCSSYSGKIKSQHQQSLSSGNLLTKWIWSQFHVDVLKIYEEVVVVHGKSLEVVEGANAIPNKHHRINVDVVSMSLIIEELSEDWIHIRLWLSAQIDGFILMQNNLPRVHLDQKSAPSIPGFLPKYGMGVPEKLSDLLDPVGLD